MDAHMTGPAKRQIALRYWLLGRDYVKALEAMNFAASYHVGVRKDGITPEFDHQISIGHYVRTILPSVSHAEDSLCVVFLHDLREDFGISHEEIETRFGARVANSVDAMTKKFRGQHADPAALFARMALDPIASVVKASDRVHNLQSMTGVFTREKQQAYVSEVRSLFLPMIKTARRNFPAQELAYENVKHMLVSQCELIEAALAA